jgi:tetratricopeptide (TPR) repeat protein
VVVPYDYSQPINTLGPPPAEPVTDEALALFGAARDAFKRGDFATALRRADDALAKTPNDTALHEFRALCLFALGRYDEAATPLYAVLAIGPGWDWPTLIGLYPGVDAYTTQLRALEAYCNAHQQSATSRFVLAYHYLTEGHLETAAKVLEQVVALKPDDTLSAKLLRQLEAARQETPGTTPAPAPVPTDTTPPEGATISGTWKAQPGPDTSIALTMEPGGTFTWRVTQKGRTQQFSGTSTFGGGVLTLAQDNGPALVGRVTWKDPSHMTFRVVGDGPTAPGLSFSKE